MHNISDTRVRILLLSCSLFSYFLLVQPCSLLGFKWIPGCLPVKAAHMTMHDRRGVSVSQETESSQTRPKCSHFEVSNSIIIDLRMEHLLLWLLGFEEKASLPASEKPSSGAGDRTQPQQRSGLALELGPPSAEGRLPRCRLLCWSTICISQSRKRLSRQS